MATVSNLKQESSSHYYFRDGKPCYEVPYSDPSKGMRKTTLADARKLNLLPSSTTILSILRKPALEAWLVEQACNSLMTDPALFSVCECPSCHRPATETIDGYVTRVLHSEKQQEREGQIARDLGTEIHAAIESALAGNEVPEPMRVYVAPVLTALEQFGTVKVSEHIIIGDGYAGKLDALFELDGVKTVVDFKTTKNLPKNGSYPEHRCQLASYAKAVGATQTANIYISTTEPGKIAVFINPPPEPDYEAFMHIFAVWKWQNNWKQ